jgi:quinolinate synthase
MQPLSEFEKERILINAMIAAQHYQQPEIQAAIASLAKSDSSERVKQAAQEIAERKKKG